MTRLQSQWLRLYAPQEPNVQANADDCVRAMVLALCQPAHWETLAAVWQGVQADLGLPAPAIAVNGTDGYQLWFSLQAPVSAAQAQAFLKALCARYMPDVAPHRLRLQYDLPMPGTPVQADQWSAFVAQDLAPMFADTPWLDVAPSPDGQADILSRVSSIQPKDFLAALDKRQPAEAPTHTSTTVPSAHEDPRRFLLNVMNDESLALSLRIDAAKALMPYMHQYKGPG